MLVVFKISYLMEAILCTIFHLQLFRIPRYWYLFTYSAFLSAGLNKHSQQCPVVVQTAPWISVHDQEFHSLRGIYENTCI